MSDVRMDMDVGQESEDVSILQKYEVEGRNPSGARKTPHDTLESGGTQEDEGMSHGQDQDDQAGFLSRR